MTHGNYLSVNSVDGCICSSDPVSLIILYLKGWHILSKNGVPMGALEQENPGVILEVATPSGLATHDRLPAYACPKCHGRLAESLEGYTCARCASFFPISQGIPDFSPETDLYWGELSAEEMREVVICAGEMGYEKAAEVASRYDPGLREYLLCKWRTDWVFHCAPLSGWKTCLDIGSGWGTLSRALLKYGLNVWSLEVMRERLAFQEAFKRFEGLDGLTLIRGTANRLPFADGSFDLVAANGIIQWVGLADHSRSVKDLQEEFLRECRRVLKPEGVLFLGCENRYGLKQLMGEKDHSGLRFTSVMPRKLADATVRRFRRTGGKFSRRFRMGNDWRDYRTHTHSVRGYEKLLKSCGYEEVQSYWAYPSNNTPRMMGRMKNARSLRALLDYSRQTLDLRIRGTMTSRSALRLRFLTGHSVLSRWLLKLSSDLVFFARPAASSADLHTVEGAVGSYAIRCSGSNKIIWWGVNGDGGKQVVKMARFPEDEKAVERDEERTARYNHTLVPKEVHGQWTLFREPLLDVRPIDALSRRENLAAVSTLLGLHARTHAGFWNAADLDEDIAGNLRTFCDLTDDEGLRQLAEMVCRAVSGALTESKLPIVTEHGDYSRDNILWDRKGRIYLIDWSHSREAGEPLFDFSMLSQIHWQTWKEVCKRDRRRAPGPAPALNSMVAAFCASSNLAPEVVFAYYPYSLLRRIVRTGPFYRHTLIEYFRSRHFPQPD